MNYLKSSVLLALLALGLAGCDRPARQAPAARAPAGDFARQALWDDGRAEMSLYSGTTERYGQERPTDARIIVVKEDLVRATLVKSDSGPIPGRTVETLKENFIADFPTGTYTYHQMASVFLDRATLQVLRESMSHTEGCGITYVRVGPSQGRWMHEAHSYWDREADREVPLAWPREPRPHLFWDALPVVLRAWADERSPREWRVWLLPTQISGRSPIESTRPADAIVRRGDGGSLEVPAGRFETVKFAVASGGNADLFWFDARPPHVLVALKSVAGRRLALRKTLRLDYWNHHAVGDEKLLE